MLTILLNGLINFEGMLEFRGAPCLISIPRPSQVLADLLATGDGVLGVAANLVCIKLIKLKSDGKIFAPWLTYFDITN